MTESSQRDVRVLRSRSHQVVCLFWAAVCLAVVTAFLVVGFTASKDPLQQVVAAMVFVALGGAAVRWAFTSVVFDYAAGTVIVRNPILTHTVPMAGVHDTETVNSRLPYRDVQRLLIKLRRTDGSTITLVGACAYSPTLALKMNNELNAALSEPMRRQLKAQHPGTR